MPPAQAEQKRGEGGGRGWPDLDALDPVVLYLKLGGCRGLGLTAAGGPLVWAASSEFLSGFARAWGGFRMRSRLRSGQMAVFGCFYGSQEMRKFLHLEADTYSKTCKESLVYGSLADALTQPRLFPRRTMAGSVREHPGTGPLQPHLGLSPWLVRPTFQGLLFLPPMRSMPSHLQTFQRHLPSA